MSCELRRGRAAHRERSSSGSTGGEEAFRPNTHDRSPTRPPAIDSYFSGPQSHDQPQTVHPLQLQQTFLSMITTRL